MKEQFSQTKLALITFTLILGSVIVNSAMDMHAPVLPEIGLYFNATETLVQWTVSSYFLGTAIVLHYSMAHWLIAMVEKAYY